MADDNNTIDKNEDENNIIGGFDKTNFDEVQRKLEPDPIQRQLDQPQPTYYRGTQTGFWGSVGGGFKSGLASTAQDIYNDARFVGQKVFGYEPDESGFNFGDRMELAKMNVASTHPNEAVMFGTQLLGMGALAVAAAPVIEGAATATGIEGAISSAASTAGKVLSERAGVGTVAESSITEASIINEANVTKAVTSPSQGLIRRFASYSGTMLPFETGANISFDSEGKAHMDTTGVLKDTALNTIAFGVFEGVGSLFRSTVSSGSEVTKSTDKINQMHKDNPEMQKKTSPLKTDMPLHNIREESQPFLNEEAQKATTPNELIDSAFTKEEHQQIIDNTLHSNKRQSPTSLHSDIRLSNEANVEYHNALTSFLDNTSKRKLTQAILSKYGVIHNGKRVSLADPVSQAHLSTNMKELRTFFDKSGQRKVALTEAYRNLPHNKKADELVKKLFKTHSYLNTGSKKLIDKEGFFIGEPIQGGSQIVHDYPLWYIESKRGVEDAQSLKELNAMYDSGSKHAAFLKSLQDASDKKWTDDYRKGLYNNIDDTIDNHMSLEDAESLIHDYKNNQGIFGHKEFTEQESALHDEVMEAIKKDENKFFDDNDQNVYFTKVLKKMQANKEATEAYITCLIG